jgi:hypothetical protein
VTEIESDAKTNDVAGFHENGGPQCWPTYASKQAYKLWKNSELEKEKNYEMI